MSKDIEIRAGGARNNPTPSSNYSGGARNNPTSNPFNSGGARNNPTPPAGPNTGKKK